MEATLRYLLVIDYAPVSILRAVERLRKRTKYADLAVLIVTHDPSRCSKKWRETDVPVEIVACSFRNDEEIIAALAPFRGTLCGIQCRGDKYVQYLRRVIPLLPAEILMSTPQSLAAATNKRLMRSKFLQKFPEITPQFVQVRDNSPSTVPLVEKKMAYPVMVKPANLAASVLIQSCHSRLELERALHGIFTQIHRIYQAEGREDEPQVIVEQYLEGDFYSIDAYVMQPGELFFCPPVAYIPAKQLGIDDFSLYKRFVPTKLSAMEIAAANEVAAKAIEAIELRHTTVHVELVHTNKGWKIIELGPRIGAYRKTMYKHAYNLDHSFNDVLIHLGERPHLPTKLLKYCATYSIYSKKEGALREITGIQIIQNSPYICFFRINRKPGDICLFAKNGGHAAAEFSIACESKAEFDSLTSWIETNVEAAID